MRIVIIGGFARSLINFRGLLLAELVEAGHEVLACAGNNDDAISAELRDMGITYYPLGLNRTGLNPVEDVAFLFRLTRFLREKKPDIVIGYTIKPVIYGSIAAFLAGIPKSYSMTQGLGYTFVNKTWKQRFLNRLVRVMYRIAMACNERVFFENSDDRDLFVQLGIVPAEKTVVINGVGVDLERFPLRELVIQPITFLLIARLIREKGVAEFAEAARIVKTKYPHAVFKLLGRFDSNPSAIPKANVERWQQEGIIEYLGVSNDVPSVIASTSVAVLPSYYREGTPVSLMEAMAMGRPIITTDMPGCRETVQHGENGFLIPPENTTALAEAMEAFVVKPEIITTMGQRSREIAIEKFDRRKINAIIREAIGL